MKNRLEAGRDARPAVALPAEIANLFDTSWLLEHQLADGGEIVSGGRGGTYVHRYLRLPKRTPLQVSLNLADTLSWRTDKMLTAASITPETAYTALAHDAVLLIPTLCREVAVH
jgi:hypothetical protein